MSDLGVPVVADNQNNKEVTINAATLQLAQLLGEPLTVDVTGNDVTVADADFKKWSTFIAQNGTTGAILRVPLIKRHFIVENQGSDDLSVRQGSGTVTITTGNAALIMLDGTLNNIQAVTGGVNAAALITGTNWSIPSKGALVGVTVDFAGSTGGSFLPWTLATYDTGHLPASGGLSQRFWLGANFDFATTDVTTGTDQIAETGHGMVTGEGPFFMSSTTTLPAGLAAATKYWCIRVDNDNFQVASNRANAIAGTQIDITDQGTGTHTVEREENLVIPAGITKVRLTAGLGADGNLAGWLSGFIAKNGSGSAVNGIAGFIIDTTTSLRNGMHSPVLEVVEGDYFSLGEQGADAYTISGDQNRTWLSIEVVETDEASDRPWDISDWFSGVPANSELLLRYVAPRAITLQDDFAGSEAESGVAALASTVIDVQVNASSIGSITFAASATVATFSTTGGGIESLVAGDVIELFGPGTADTNLADIAFSLKGTLT